MKNFPAIKLALLFIMGILLQFFFELSLTFYIVSIIATTVTSIIFFSYKRALRLFTIPIFLLIISIGGLHLLVNNLNKQDYPFELPVYKKVHLFGKIESMELLSKGRIIFQLKSDAVIISGKQKEIQTNVRVTIKDNSIQKLKKFYDSISVGNSVTLKGTIREPRNERNPGEFDYKKYLLTKNVTTLFSVNSINNVSVTKTEVKIFTNQIFKIRKYIAKIFEKYNKPLTAAFLKGFILADRSEIDETIKENFVNAGVIHVLAVSGLHVGFIVLICLVLFGRFNIYLKNIFTIIGLILFAIIAGGQPSVFRATVMAVIIIFTGLTSRSTNNYNSLSIAAIIILIINPNDIFNPGFQFSFSSVLAIITFMPVFNRQIKSLNIKSSFVNWVLIISAVSLSAEIGTLPFAIIYFNKIPSLAIFANIIIIPLVGIIIGIGLFTIFINFFSSFVAFIYGGANDFFIYTITSITDFIGNLKIAYLYVVEFSLFDSFIFYLFLSIAFYAWSKFSSIPKIAVLIFVALNLYLIFPLDNKQLLPDGKLSIVMLDIGQGDSFFVKFPNGKTALIDAGDANLSYDNGKRVIIPFLKRNGIEKINYAFISHVDADHYKGILSIIKAGLIDTLYKPTLDNTLAKDVKFENFIKKHNLPIHYYKREIKRVSNSTLYILNNCEDKYYKRLDVNNKSGIIKLVYGKNSFLFIGDAEKEMETLLCRWYPNFLKSDILKVSHHGSKTGSCEKFLSLVKPEMGIISTGIGNKFKHPAKEVIERLKSHEIKIRRTDKLGAVILTSDGISISELNWREL